MATQNLQIHASRYRQFRTGNFLCRKIHPGHPALAGCQQNLFQGKTPAVPQGDLRLEICLVFRKPELRKVHGEIGTGQFQPCREFFRLGIPPHPQKTGQGSTHRAFAGLGKKKRGQDSHRPADKLDHSRAVLLSRRLPLSGPGFFQPQRGIEGGVHRLHTIPVLGHQNQGLYGQLPLGAGWPGSPDLPLHGGKIHRPGPLRRPRLHRDRRIEIRLHEVMPLFPGEFKRPLPRCLRPLPLRREVFQQRNHEGGFRPGQFHPHPPRILRRSPQGHNLGIQERFPRLVGLQFDFRKAPGALLHLHIGREPCAPGTGLLLRPTHCVEGDGNQSGPLLGGIPGELHMSLGLAIRRPEFCPRPRLSQTGQPGAQVAHHKSLFPRPVPLRLGRQHQILRHPALPRSLQLSAFQVKLGGLLQMPLKIERSGLDGQAALHPAPRGGEGTALHPPAQPDLFRLDPCLTGSGKLPAFHLQFFRFQENRSHRRQLQPPRRPLQRGRFRRLRFWTSRQRKNRGAIQ